MPRMRYGWAALLLLVVLCPASSQATPITVFLPDYNGPENTTSFPVDLGVVGTFSYSLPLGAVITSAAFSGTYGTALVPSSTAGFDVVIAGQTITVCIPNDPGCWQGGAAFRPFSFALSPVTFAALLGGSVPLDVVQTNEFVVRLGTPTLTIEYDAVPEPGTLLLLGSGLSALALRRRRKV